MPARRGGTRNSILEAGYELIGELGFDRATTARVCARAGVSSGTFFHYFPTKTALLVGILEAAADVTRRRDEHIAEVARVDPERALDMWLAGLMHEAADPHLPNFVSALGAVAAEPAVQSYLRAATSSTHAALTAVVDAGQRALLWRRDTASDDLALWLGVIADGVLTRSAEDPTFDVHTRQSQLRDILARTLADAAC